MMQFSCKYFEIEKKIDNIFALLFSHFFWLGHFDDIFGQVLQKSKFSKKKLLKKLGLLVYSITILYCILVQYSSKKNWKDSTNFPQWNMTLKIRILRCSRRLFVTLASLTVTLFIEKLLISNSGFMPNSIKNLWRSLLIALVYIGFLPPRLSLMFEGQTLWEGHKIWKNLQPVLKRRLFFLSSNKTSGRFFLNFCSLFRWAGL